MTVSWQLKEAPSLAPLYVKALLKRNRYRDGQELPALRCEWKDIVFDAERLAEYRKLCCVGEPEVVPPLFPHLHLGPVHLLFLSSSRFPLKPLGAVHSRNHLIQYAPLSPTATYQATLGLSGQRRRPQGLEFDLSTELRTEGKLVWASVSTYLVRKKMRGEDPPSALSEAVSNLSAHQRAGGFEVPLDTGKRFGRLSGDVNPIHMSSALAKLFGFRRDLAHGMWSAARCLALLPQHDWSVATRYDVAFKGPLYMGEPVVVQRDPRDAGAFELYGGDNERPSVVARLRAASQDERLQP